MPNRLELTLKKPLMVLGNEAIALGLVDGGIGYVASYPGTPSTEIMEYLVAFPGNNFHADWSTNEAVALEEAIAASITGTDSAFIAKSVGLNVAMDALMTISNSGTNGALVLIIADDPGMHSSQNEQDTRVVAAKFANIPIFEPSTPQEAYFYARVAIDLSRTFEIPVLLRTVTRLSHALAPVHRSPPRMKDSKPYIPNISKFVSIPGNARKNHHAMLSNHKIIQNYINSQEFYEEIITHDDPEFLIFTSGNCANYTVEAIKGLGVSAHLFIPKIVNPLPIPKILTLLEKFEHILIIEELEPFLEEKIRLIINDHALRNLVIGKNILTSKEGELTIENVKAGLISYLELTPSMANTIALPTVDDVLRFRPPVLCAGCPHRSSYVELGESLKSYNPIYCNDIGCYSLGVMPPHKSADMLICMGASIPMATATSVTQPDRLAVAVIGDSTFWHSGLSGLANAIWKNANILVVIVDNSFTAMTGGQPNPSSQGDSLNISKVVASMGAKVFEINPMEYKKSRQVIREAAKIDGVRVIVSNFPCALRKDTQDKFKMNSPLTVIEDKCTGCSLCESKLGCPAISMEAGLGKIDPALCNGCGMCEQICRHDAIVRYDLNG